MNFLCISGYYKGSEFLEACKAEGNTVYLVTSKKLRDKPWPRASIDEIYYMEELEDGSWNMDDFIKGMAFMMRHTKIDRVVALDDFDVEKAAHIREFFRIPGMGQTTARLFRDKLAMRFKALDAGLNVPAFSGLFNDTEINDFIAKVEAPWLVKPRSEASATGITKLHNAHDLWEHIHSLGEERQNYLVEQFRPGDVYHVDSLSVDSKVVFARVAKYMDTPFEVAHGGGIFRTATVGFGSEDDKALQKMNKDLMKAFGMYFSACHTEYIKDKETGAFYFLETASRVGGAHISDMVEATSGINLWAEWAKLETAKAYGKPYKFPKVNKDHAGLIVSLSRFQRPDNSSFNDPEIWWRMDEDYHIGLIVKSKDQARVHELLDKYAKRIFNEFHASAPAPEKSAH